MKMIAAAIVLMFLFSGCLQKSFCEEMQPRVANYFGEEFYAANVMSMDHDSPYGNMLESMDPIAGGERLQGSCSYSFRTKTITFMYIKSGNYANESVQEMKDEMISLPDRYGESRIVEGSGYVYSYYPALGLSPGYNTQMLVMRKDSTLVQVIGSVMLGEGHPEGKMRDFALEVGQKVMNS